jgi:PAS domain S-box-containing protein
MILGKIRAGDRIDHFQTIRLHKNGARIPISLSVSPIRDAQGKIIGAAKIARDISQQVNDQQAALRYSALVESSEDAIITKDLNGIITSWNPAAERIFGYAPHEIIGRNVLTIIPKDLHPDETVILGKIRAGERIEHFQTVRMHKNGMPLDVSLTVSPVRDGGKIIGAAKIVRDVTRQRKMENALHTSERLASVGRLAATIAHEINNPLEAVTNFIYLCRQAPDLPPNVAEYLKIADQELNRVALVAQQTLGFYRDNTRPVMVAVAEAVNDVLTIFTGKIRYKNIFLEKRFASDLRFHTLHGQLKQILLNLVGNSIDASRPEGRLVISAHVLSHLGSRRVLALTVADNGTGIAEHNRHKVFEPFFTTKKDVGTGLGLWITRDLVQRKGGNIRFRTRTGEGSGTCMTVFLPEDPSAILRESAA